MQVQRGMCVDDWSLYAALKRCTAQKDLVLGVRIHALATLIGFESNMLVASQIICMYLQHRKLEEALQAFTRISEPSPSLWSCIILAHARYGKPALALNLYSQLRKSSLKADSHILVAVLKACARAKDLRFGMQVHADILASGDKPNLFVRNCLLDMYSKCGSLENARRVFDSAPTRDVITWNSMIAAYTQHGFGQEALALYASMEQQEGGCVSANHVTFVCLLQACAKARALNEGEHLHAQICERGLQDDVVVRNCLVNMYAKCGSLEDARRVFDNLPSKDVVTWTSMIAGYAQHGLGQEALSLYENMQREGIIPADAITFVCLLQACASISDLDNGTSLHKQIQKRGLEADVTVANSLVSMYAKCGSFDDACRVFDNLASKDVVTWNAMITGYVQQGLNEEALELHTRMQEEGITLADSVTFVYLLQACGNSAVVAKGKQIHAQLSEAGLDATGVALGNALIDMYGKCGSMVEAQEMFDALPTKDVTTWSALIAGYARQGNSDLVFTVFESMRQDGVQPNGVTFLSVLMVCSHVGLVDQGQKHFEAMSRDYGIIPAIEHYNCMVDMLGRAGRLHKAVEMLRNMPLPPQADAWRCFLGACQKWKNVELGKQAFECALEVDANDAALYAIMANIYAAADMWEEARGIHLMRLRARTRKEPGQSWSTDCGGVVHTFVAGNGDDSADRQHIHEMLAYFCSKLDGGP